MELLTLTRLNSKYRKLNYKITRKLRSVLNETIFKLSYGELSVLYLILSQILFSSNLLVGFKDKTDLAIFFLTSILRIRYVKILPFSRLHMKPSLGCVCNPLSCKASSVLRPTIKSIHKEITRYIT